MKSSTTHASSDELTFFYTLLKRLAEDAAALPTKEECKQIAACFFDVEKGPLNAHIARHFANHMCCQTDAASRRAGILVLKELSKKDPYAKLLHAWLRWNEGPLKNHQHALVLIDEILEHEWPEWPMYERAHLALGEAYRLKGLLLFRGEKVKHNPSEALWLFKWAADKYLDGEAAWLAAQFHTRTAKRDFAHKAKPHAKAHDWYTKRAVERGYNPEKPFTDEQVQS